MTYCFDSRACLRFIDREEGYSRVVEIVRSRTSSNDRLIISAIQWGEIASITGKRRAAQTVSRTLSMLVEIGFIPVPVSPDQAIRTASIQNELKLSYADAFLVALAQEQNQPIIVTADYDFKAAEHLVSIEFLPVKPKLPPQP